MGKRKSNTIEPTNKKAADFTKLNQHKSHSKSANEHSNPKSKVDNRNEPLTSESLCQSEELLRMFVKYTPAAVAMFDLEMKYLLYSDRWLFDYKLGSRNLVGLSHYEVFPEIEERWKIIHRKCLKGFSQKNEEDKFIRQDGSVEWVKWEIHPWRTHKGKVGGIVMFTEVITERKHAEEALLESEQKFRDLVETTSDWVWTVDKDVVYTYSSPKVKELLGYEPVEIVGKTPFDLMTAREAQRIRPVVENALKNKKEFIRLENINIHKDGREVILETSGVPILDDKGNLIGYRGIDRDITERKHAEEELCRSESFKKSILDSLPAHIVVLNEQGIISAVNQSWVKFGRENGLAKDSEDWIGTNYLDICRNASDTEDSLAKEALKGIADVLNGQISQFSLEYPCHLPTQQRWFLMNVVVPSYGFRGAVITHLNITEHKQAEKALKASRHRFVTLANYAPVGIFETDAHGDCMFVNEYWCRISGLSPTQAFGKLWIEGIDPQDRQRVSDVWYDAVKSKREFSMEYRFRTPDGKVTWVIGSGKLLLDSSGAVTSYLGTVLDITERKQAEEALRHGEEKLRLALEGSKMGMWDWNIISGELVWSDRCREIFALGPDIEITYDIFLDTIHPEDRRRIDLAVRDALAKKTDYDEEMRIIGPDGSVRWIAAKGRSFFDTQGKPLRMVGIVMDITDRKHAEEALRASEEKFRAIVETTKEWIWMSDMDGITTYCNPAVKDLLGYSVDEIIGKNSFYLIHPDDRANIESMFRTKIVQKVGWTKLIVKWRHKDGSYRYMESNAVPIFDTKGQLIGFQGADRDITERKLAEEQLLQAAEELKRSNRELEQFAYMASHDLQEPLRNVTGFVTLLRDRYQDKLDERAGEFIEFIVNGARWMEKMIDDLLEYSRVGTKGNPMKPTEFGDVLKTTLLNLKTIATTTHTKITHDKLPVVYADSIQITQLLQNLIGNAIKFRKPDQPPRIHIGCQKQQDSWLFSIKDNGIGIDSKDLDRIFLVFSRLHAREEYPGTGIGLAVCKKIIERHGGRIWVESQLGKGTTFFFTIPSMQKNT